MVRRLTGLLDLTTLWGKPDHAKHMGLQLWQQLLPDCILKIGEHA